MSHYAWVTLATNDSYSLGALVLAHSLKRVSTAHQLAILITPTVSESMRNKLKDVFNIVQEVNVLDSQDSANLALLSRPELGITFTKIHCWRLVQFEKCVFLDADTLVLKNCDELFEREEFSAAPDVGWPDCFNSGVFVFRPSLDTFAKITQFALEKGSFDGGDQGLLNSFFSDWSTSDIARHLPFSYNTCSTATYSYLPAFKQFADRIKILHFIGHLKPWLLNFNSQSKTVYTPQEYGHMHMFLQFWWDLFCDNVHSKLTDEMKHNTRQIANYSSNEYQNYYNRIDRDEFHTAVVFNIVIRDPWEDYYENLEREQKESVLNVVNTESTNNIINDVDNNCNNEENEQNVDSYSPCPVENRVDINLLDQPEQIGNNNFNNTQQYSIEAESVPSFDTATIVHDPDQKTDSDNNSVFSEEHRLERNVSSLATLVQSEILPKDNENNGQPNNASHRMDINSNSFADIDIEGGLAAALAKVRLGEERSPEQEAYEQHIRRQCWESGNIDYSGRDSFDNIWRKISQTMSSASKPAEPPKEKDPGKRLTSADIQDGKVVVDRATGAKTTYKKIDKGYEMIIETPQPNGTMKIEVQTFYDPQPLTDEELAVANKPEGTYKKGNVTTVVKKIPGGKQLTITKTNPDGTQTVQTQTVYEATEEEITQMTQVEEAAPKKTTKVTSKKVPGGTAFDETNKKQLVKHDSTTTEEVSVKSKRTVEESRKVTETTEISGKSTKTSKKNQSIEQGSVPAIEGAKPKKASKPKKVPLPDDFVEKPGESTTLEKRRVEGGTEYIYTTILADGRSQVSKKTVQEEEGVDMTEEEIEEYKRQRQEAEKYKKLKKGKKIQTETGTKTIVPSENEGEVTTLETIQIDGGTEYHYTTVCADGTVRKSTKTIYDKVAVEGSDEEYEEVEEYEEEIIEPGDPIVETIERIKTITAEERLTSADIEDGKVEYNKTTGVRITYKIIENGYQKTIETPQPNGTMKTETKRFYDPRPVPQDQLESPKKSKKKPSTDIVPKAPGQMAMDPKSSATRTIVHQGSTTEEITVRSHRTYEETRRVTETSEVSEKKKLGQAVPASNGDAAAPKKKGKKSAAK